MYSIASFGGMIRDQVRMTAYVEALRQAVRPDSVVLDIGAGTGVFALLACQFGARHVYAVEPLDAVHAARTMATANGYAERITFIQGMTTRITLPEPVDIIIYDLRGTLPVYTTNIASIIDARRRFLAPGGVMIPQSDKIWAAPVEAPELWHKYEAPWLENEYGLDMSAAFGYQINRWMRDMDGVKQAQLLAKAQVWATIDYTTITSPNISVTGSWEATRSGLAHGLTVWFDAATGNDIGFSNAPWSEDPCKVYGRAFFPFRTPVALQAGDLASVALDARLVNEEYIWQWKTEVLAQGDPGRVLAKFRQSTFDGEPLTMATLRKRGSNFVPSLDTEGQVAQLALSLMDGVRSLEEIAQQVAVRYPVQFSSWKDALPAVGKLSEKYDS